MKSLILPALAAGMLAGCAGSASHKVVSAHQSSDDSINCAQIDAELIRTQVIIDDVHKDKEDISGSDVLDGVL